jgi:ribosomal protein S18 acetylase RimI-like enzyme
MNNIIIREADRNDLIKIQSLSTEWSDENITYGYSTTSLEELEKYRVWVAEVNGIIVGYLGGYIYESTNMKSVMPIGTKCFEIEELYVSKQYRSLKIGSLLYDTMMKELLNENVIYVTLVAANRNTKQLLDFYTNKDMNVFSTRLFRQISGN